MSILQRSNNESSISSPQFTELTFVEDKLQEIMTKAPGIISETCVALLNSGGKRVRPLLTIQSGMIFRPLTNDLIYAATASELIHMASLIHDDIIDASDTRRGLETINHVHGNTVAVLTGDYIFAEAFNILSSHHLLSSMGYLVEAIKKMCDGEVNQAAEAFNPKITVEQYFDRIAKKTAILLASSCKSGAATAEASDYEINSLGKYGLFIGYAFQIIDDILDFFGSEENLGKPVGADITNGNITLPVILLMNNPIYGDWLKELIITKKITPKGVESIKAALINTESIAQSYKIAADCIKTAKASLDEIPNNPHKTILIKMADKVLERKN